MCHRRGVDTQSSGERSLTWGRAPRRVRVGVRPRGALARRRPMPGLLSLVREPPAWGLRAGSRVTQAFPEDPRSTRTPPVSSTRGWRRGGGRRCGFSRCARPSPAMQTHTGAAWVPRCPILPLAGADPPSRGSRRQPGPVGRGCVARLKQAPPIAVLAALPSPVVSFPLCSDRCGDVALSRAGPKPRQTRDGHSWRMGPLFSLCLRAPRLSRPPDDGVWKAGVRNPARPRSPASCLTAPAGPGVS